MPNTAVAEMAVDRGENSAGLHALLFTCVAVDVSMGSSNTNHVIHIAFDEIRSAAH